MPFSGVSSLRILQFFLAVFRRKIGPLKKAKDDRRQIWISGFLILEICMEMEYLSAAGLAERPATCNCNNNTTYVFLTSSIELSCHRKKMF